MLSPDSEFFNYLGSRRPSGGSRSGFRVMGMILLAFGLVLVVEGLAYALAPSLIERMLRGVAQLCRNRLGRLMGMLCAVSGLGSACGRRLPVGILTQVDLNLPVISATIPSCPCGHKLITLDVPGRLPSGSHGQNNVDEETPSAGE